MNHAKVDLRRTALTILISFAAGLVAGLIFWALREPSPAPPWLALAALLGIVLGEQLGISARNWLSSRRKQRAEQAPPADSGESS